MYEFLYSFYNNVNFKSLIFLVIATGTPSKKCKKIVSKFPEMPCFGNFAPKHDCTTFNAEHNTTFFYIKMNFVT